MHVVIMPSKWRISCEKYHVASCGLPLLWVRWPGRSTMGKAAASAVSAALRKFPLARWAAAQVQRADALALPVHGLWAQPNAWAGHWPALGSGMSSGLARQPSPCRLAHVVACVLAGHLSSFLRVWKHASIDLSMVGFCKCTNFSMIWKVSAHPMLQTSVACTNSGLGIGSSWQVDMDSAQSSGCHYIAPPAAANPAAISWRDGSPLKLWVPC